MTSVDGGLTVATVAVEPAFVPAPRPNHLLRTGSIVARA